MNTQTQVAASELTQIGLSAAEVAKLLGVSVRHVWTLYASGRLPQPVRLGRATRWHRTEIEAWMAAGAPSADRWTTIKGGGR